MAGGEMVRAGADDETYADADVDYHDNADQFGAAAAAAATGGGQQGGGRGRRQGGGGGNAAIYGSNNSAVYGGVGDSTSVQYATAIDYAAQGVYGDAAQAPVDYAAAAGVYGDAAYAPASEQNNQSLA
jgi:hypothetical protein